MTKMLIPVVLVGLSATCGFPAFSQPAFRFSTTASLAVTAGDNGEAVGRTLHSELLKDLNSIDGVDIVDVADVKHHIAVVVVATQTGIAAVSVTVTARALPTQERVTACAEASYSGDVGGVVASALQYAVFVDQQYVFTSFTTDLEGLARNISNAFRRDIIQREKTFQYTLWHHDHPESQ